MDHRDSASFGKRQEFVAFGELLKRGFDVYMTLVDDQQIDCVIRLPKKPKPVYLDIQIKARSSQANIVSAGQFSALVIKDPRENFFYIFYSEPANSYWVIPSLALVKEANRNKEGKNKGKYSIVFTNKTKPRPKFEKYLNNFDLLRAGNV